MEEEMTGTGAGETATPVAETPATVRRGRGRPRKQVQEPVDPAAPKRPRGRPRGSKNKAHRATPIEPPKEKRPRGRPRKWPQKAVQQQEVQVQEGETGQEENQPSLPSPEECV